MGEVGLTTAFLAGLLSFLSPCVLPLVPGYLSFISGVSIQDMTEGRRARIGRVFIHSLFFVLGFSLVFVALGATATAVGGFIKARFTLFNRLAGALIILFGLQLLGVWRFRFLMADRRYHGKVWGGLPGAALLGMAFAFGWSPCVGPILFAILFYASTQEKVWVGIRLLAFYSAGLGLPFLLIGTGVGSFIRFLDRFQKYLRWVEVAGGILLVAIGLLVMSGYMQKVAGLIPQDWLLPAR